MQRITVATETHIHTKKVDAIDDCMGMMVPKETTVMKDDIIFHSYMKSTYANYRTVVIDVSVIYNTIHSLQKRTRAGLHKHLFKVCAC